MERDELARLSGLARGGDIDARNRLVEANLGLVGPAVRSFLRRGAAPGRMGPDDLFQEGRRGLIEAAGSFDAARGFAFSTHASALIRAYIARAASAAGAVVPTARSRADAARWRKLAAGGMGEPEIARELGLCARGVDRVRAAMAAREACFHGAVEGRDGNLESHADADPSELEDWVHEGLSRLEARDREALVLRYGIGGREPVRGDALARRLGVTRAGASHVVKMARGRLAALLSA